MNLWTNSREDVLNIPVPAATKTYTPIPNSVFLEEVETELTNRGYGVSEERFITSLDKQVLAGTMRITNGKDDLEMAPSISFVNSYNKTRRASIRSSAVVLVCRNGMMADMPNSYYARMHKGNALEDFREHINIVIDGMEAEYRRLLTNRDEMKEIVISPTDRAAIIGDIFLNERMISMTQLGIVEREIRTSKDFHDSTVWSLYNNVTESFHKSRAAIYDRQHVKWHTYVADQFRLTGSRGLYTSILN